MRRERKIRKVSLTLFFFAYSFTMLLTVQLEVLIFEIDLVCLKIKSKLLKTVDDYSEPAKPNCELHSK